MKIPAIYIPTYWRATILLGLGDAINYGDRAAMSSVLPKLHQDLGLSDSALGLLGSLFLWTYAICSPIAGTLADRYSRMRICMYSLAVWSAVMATTGFASGLITLCMLRIGLGFSESFYLPSATALIGDLHEFSTRARALNVLNCAEIVGLITLGTVAGFLANDHGWRPVFWTLGAVGVGYALVFRAFLPDDPVKSKENCRRPRLSETFDYLIHVPSYHILLAKVIFVGVAVWIFFTWLPYYFHESFSMKLGPAGFSGAFLPSAASLLGFPMGGWISDFVAARTNVRHRMLIQGCCYLVAAPFLLFFVGRPSFAMITVALLLFGFIRSIGDSNEQAILCEIIPSRFRSTAVGLMNMCATSAGGLGVLLAGMEKHNFGLATIFAATMGLIILAAIALLTGYHFFMARDIARAHECEMAMGHIVRELRNET